MTCYLAPLLWGARRWLAARPWTSFVSPFDEADPIA